MRKVCLNCGKHFEESKLSIFKGLYEYDEYCASCNLLGLAKLRHRKYNRYLKSKNLLGYYGN